MNAHYEKVIVACAFLTLFVNIGFPSTSFNVYMPYVVGEVGDVGGSLVLALRTLASMGAVIVVDRYFHLFDLRVGLALGFAFTATGFAVYGFASTLPVFLAGGVITGLGYGLGGMVGVTMLIRRWYASGFSGAIGLASVGSGVASVVVPICAVHLIEGLSLSISFRIQAFVALVIGVIVFLAMRNRPADMGIKPFERDDGTGTAKRGMSGAGRNVSPRTRKLLLVAVTFVGMLCVGGPSYLSILMGECGFDSVFAAAVLSALGVSLTIAKFVSGKVFDRFGTAHGSTIFFMAFVCGPGLCLLSPLHLEPVMVLAAVLYGAGAALGTVGVSVWSVEFADPKNYARSIKNFQLAYSAGGFVANTFPGALKELTGSYMDTYALFFVLASAAMAIVVGIYASHRLRNCARPAA